MKSYLLIFCFFSIALFGQIKPNKPKVLFIGNSYTYVNNLPQLIHDMAVASGDSLLFDSNCPGGYTFQNHLMDLTTIAKINWGKWDYVVLQAQSQEPAFSPVQVAAQTLPYAIALDTMIKNHNPCATTVFYETWGRKFGDASNCAAYPPICTYVGMQNRLKQSYQLFADTCHALMSPAGEAYRESITLNPNLELYQSDQSHPSIEGSYLTACVFYEMLYQKSVIGNTFNPGIGSSTLTFLQQTAHNTINDSLGLWHIGEYVPKAGFSYSVQGNVVQLVANYPYLNHTWYFGDGTMNLGYQLQHQYQNPGNKVISHVVDNGCKRDSVALQILVSTTFTGLHDNQNMLLCDLYPNPSADNFSINHLNKINDELPIIHLSNVIGESYTLLAQQGVYETKQLANGLYFVSFREGARTFFAKLLVQH